MLSEVLFITELVPGKILYFSCPELRTTVPHYFIIISQFPGNVFNLSCCTSKFETVRALIERRRYPNETLAFIPPENGNPFRVDTYVNCNEYFGYSFEELWLMYSDQELTLHGELPIHSLEQIVLGLRASPQIEDEIKESLPDI